MSSINNIRLNHTILKNLYGKSLVSEPVTAPAKQVTLKYLGNNAKQIVVLVNNPLNAFLSEDRLNFLTKMLGACKLNMGDIAIVNMVSANMGQVMNELTPSSVISFDFDIQSPEFTVTERNGIRYLYAPSLDRLDTETADAKAMKASLWKSLKELFGIQ